MKEGKPKVLIVEDSKDISDLIALYLEDKYWVQRAYTGEEAVRAARKKEMDLVILDIMLPGLSGYEVLKFIRENNNVPVIVVSAKDTDGDKIIGLQKGADDYLVKPFNPLELAVRVEAQLRRFYNLGGAGSGKEPDIIKIQNLTLDCEECCLYKNEQKIILTSKEYKLLKLLMSSPGRIFTKKVIFETVWEEEYLYDSNTIMVYISRLRDYIEEDSKKPRFIVTVRGLGYKFEK